MRRIALDTNILAYLAGVAVTPADKAKVANTRDLIDRLRGRVALVAPAQTLGELFIVMRRAGVPSDEARSTLGAFVGWFDTPISQPGTFLSAADLSTDHKLQFWDALIISVAAEAGSTLLLSEDMQHGFVTRGLTIINPFAEKPHPKLAALLSDG